MVGLIIGTLRWEFKRNTKPASKPRFRETAVSMLVRFGSFKRKFSVSETQFHETAFEQLETEQAVVSFYVVSFTNFIVHSVDLMLIYC